MRHQYRRRGRDDPSGGYRSMASSRASSGVRSEQCSIDYTSAYSSAYSMATSVYSRDPEVTRPEPRRRKRPFCSCSFVLLWVMLMYTWISLHQQYSFNALQAISKEAMALKSNMLPHFAIKLETTPSSSVQPPELLTVDRMSSLEEGAPEAKFTPGTKNQQIDKLLKVNLHQQLEEPKHSERVVEFKKSKHIAFSDNLSQCAGILQNPNSLAELVYWETHPADHSMKSIYYNVDTRFITFEPDTGGFSSQRLVLEQMVLLAYALGRTLVLPPRQGMLDGTLLSYEDYFDLRISLSEKYDGIRIITMEQFLEYVAIPGHLPSKPQFERLNWDSAEDIGKLYKYFRTAGTIPYDWDPNRCILGMNEEQLQKQLQRILKRADGRPLPSPIDFQGKPTAVNAPDIERLREFLGDRKEVCSHTKYSDAITLHIPTTSEAKSLVYAPFYSFFFFDNYMEDLMVKRMIRDEFRYNDIIACAAARIVDWLRSHDGEYEAFHIRGPAFEDRHSDVNTNPEWIIPEVRKYIKPGSIVYISTDHRDKTWFDPLRKHYQLYFASDFSGVFDSLLPWYMQMVEQLICARSKTFVGTYYSTFSGYINRLRGYYSQRDELPEGWEDGEIASYYASPVSQKREMKLYRALRPPFYAREFPVAWRDINHSVE